jgi:hypothetical protein
MNIIDIYDIMECGTTAATPATTVGMGNPMTPGDGGACKLGAAGSEPLTGKCKKSKKKTYEEPSIKEGILSNMEDTITAGDDLMEIVKWWAEQFGYGQYELDDSEIKLLSSRLSIENKNTLVVDCKDIRLNIIDEFYIKDKLPKNINNIKVINCNKTAFNILTNVEDLSNISFEVYRDNGKIFASIVLKMKIKAGKTLKLGKLTCDNLTIDAPGIETLFIDKETTVLEYNLGTCGKLTDLYGNFGGATQIRIPKKMLKYYLCSQGYMSWGAEITIL